MVKNIICVIVEECEGGAFPPYSRLRQDLLIDNIGFDEADQLINLDWRDAVAKGS
jgi:hypothetical protein